MTRSKRMGLGATFQQPSSADESTTVRALSDLSVLQSTVFANADEAADTYLGFVMQTLGVRDAILTSFDSQCQYVTNTRSDNGCDIAIGGPTSLENTFCQYVRTRGMPVIISDAAQDVRVMNLATRKAFGIGSYLGVPLVFSTGAVYGTLCALDPEPHTFSTTHVAIMRSIARHIALLIECTSPRLTPTSEEASSASEPQTTILNMVIHDLRNPLSGIQGYIELLLRNLLGPLTDDQRDVLTRMAGGAQVINRLITDLVDAAAAKSGTISLLTEEIDPFALGQSVLELFHDEAIDRELTLRIDGTSNVPMMVGDRDRVHQILSNLVGNALRHTPIGEVLLYITAQDDTVLFTVKDTGPGIAKDAQAAIWQKHTRLTTKGRGLGLGLHIVQQLAQAMNGSFGVDSMPGQGSTFWVRLPVQAASPLKARFHSA